MARLVLLHGEPEVGRIAVNPAQVRLVSQGRGDMSGYVVIEFGNDLAAYALGTVEEVADRLNGRAAGGQPFPKPGRPRLSVEGGVTETMPPPWFKAAHGEPLWRRLRRRLSARL